LAPTAYITLKTERKTTVKLHDSNRCDDNLCSRLIFTTTENSLVCLAIKIPTENPFNVLNSFGRKN
jgi:hypothetical protein